MSTEDKLRIEVEADRRARKWLEVQYTAAKTEYIAGATVEHERLTLEIKRLKQRLESYYGGAADGDL